jgi:isopentenyl-diphosphate delta-isomerase
LVEYFDIFDEAGCPLGTATRHQAHLEGLWHRAANVFLFRSGGELLIQRRSRTKDVCPGAWDVSVAEHLVPGESFEEAARRGLREELGVMDVVLEPLGGVVRSRLELAALSIRDLEFQRSYRATFNGPVVPDPGEVIATRDIGLAELALALRQHPDDFTPWFRRRIRALGLLSGVTGREDEST